MDQKIVAKDWFDGADEAWKAIFKFGGLKEGHLALFFLHLSLEKTLKGLHLVKFNKPAPFIHDLVQLADAVKFETTEEEKSQLADISRFNIAARYDDYKYRLREKATPSFVKEWMKVGESFKKILLEEVRKYE